MKLNVMGLVESRHQKPSLRDKEDFGLFMGLRDIREHVIMHGDVCNLSFFKERGSRGKIIL